MRKARASTGVLALMALAGVVVSAHPPTAVHSEHRTAARRPALTIKASPSVGFAPSTFTFMAELRGGPDDYEEYYCPTVEWDWGDGTISSSTLDCNPYEAGKTTITRRYTMQRVFRAEGTFRIAVRLMRGDKPLVESATSITVRAGVGPGY